MSAPFEISAPSAALERTPSGWHHGRVYVALDELSVSRAPTTPGCRFRTDSIAARRTLGAIEPTHEAGTLTLARDGAREELVAHPRGIEQRWVFAARPEAPLEVVVAFEGRYLGAHDGDAHFACPDDGSAIYGAATFVDANGVRTPVAREIREGNIVLRVPDDVAANAAYPAVLDPVVGPEGPVDAPIGMPVGAATWTRPAVAGGAAGWLTAWFTNDDGLWVNRVGLDGSLPWPTGVRVAGAPAQAALGVSFDGTSGLVAWRDGGAVRARRVDAAGAFPDPAPLPIMGLVTDPDTRVLDATWDGTHHVIVDGRRAARVSASGDVVSSVELPVLEPGGAWRSVACRSDGNCLVVGVSPRRVVAVRLSVGGVIDPIPVGFGPEHPYGLVAFEPRAAWSGSSWLVVVDRNVKHLIKPWAEIHVLRVSADLAELGDVVLDVGRSPDVGCASGTCRVAFGTRWATEAVAAVRIDASGAVLDPAPVPQGPTGDSVRVGCGASRCLTIAISTGVPVVTAVRTDAASVLDAPPLVVSRTPNAQSAPLVAAAGSTALVAWRDGREPSGYYRVRLTSAGVLDASAERLIPATFPDYVRAAGLGSEWLVVHPYGERLASRWVDASGTASTASWLVMGPTHSQASVACGTSTCLAVWRDTRDAPPYRTGVRARRIVKGGPDPADLVVAAASTSRTYHHATVAAGPAGFLVAHGSSDDDVYVTTVDASGAVGETIPLGTKPSSLTALSAAWVDGVWIVLWADYVAATKQSVLGAVRVSADGKTPLGAPILVATFSGYDPSGPSVTRADDGHTALVTWRQAGAIRGAFVANDGRLLDPGGFVVENDAAGLAAAAAIGPGKLVVAHHRSPHALESRVFARFVESGALDGSTCTDAATCASRRCVDGVCCDRACDGACETCGTGTCTPKTAGTAAG